MFALTDDADSPIVEGDCSPVSWRTNSGSPSLLALLRNAVHACWLSAIFASHALGTNKERHDRSLDGSWWSLKLSR